MPHYTRQPGLANIPGITAIRLVDKDVISAIKDFKSTATLAEVLTLSDITKIYTFTQLVGQPTFSYTQSFTEAGTIYDYKASWDYARNRIEMLAFIGIIAQKQFVLAVADGNGKFMLLGRPEAPFTVNCTFDADAGNFSFEAMGQCTTPPQFITGIFNTVLYLMGSGTY